MEQSTVSAGSFAASRGRTQSESWVSLRSRVIDEKRNRRFAVFAAESMFPMALRLQAYDPSRFKVFPISWEKFPDGTDNITISGFSPTNEIAGENVLFFASFHNNDVTLSQFSAMIVLLQSFIESFTIVLPFYPVGTMERVDEEGKVATAFTYSILLSNLPSIGKPNRIMIYDIHTLQNRFYFHGATIASLHSAIPQLYSKMALYGVDAVAFPDEGAAKRFGKLFDRANISKIVCGKVRDGSKRMVTVQDGDPSGNQTLFLLEVEVSVMAIFNFSAGKEVIIVDDLVQTGGTLHECALALKAKGALRVSAYVTHAVFPNGCWKDFLAKQNGSKAVFHKFFVTNSIPNVTSNMPEDDVFEIVDLLPQIVQDLDLAPR